jgi:hypothetical protein
MYLYLKEIVFMDVDWMQLVQGGLVNIVNKHLAS